MRKTVAEFAGGDLASELAHGLRIESSVLCRSVMAPPWGFGVAGRDAGSFHLVLEGEGWLDVEGTDDTVRLQAGDLVVLPRGDAHWVRDAPASEAPPLTSILAEHTVIDGELHFGGDRGRKTEIVCGVFRNAAGSVEMPGRLLPPVIHLRSRDAASWRIPVFSALRDEARAPTLGGSAVVNRLLESLLADALRHAVTTLSDSRADRRAFTDPRIGPVLARLRQRPDANWSVASMARLAAMSRSAFIDRFRTAVGQPPMRYVSSLRLGRARDLLRTTDVTIADAARQVGYGSEAAFSRAYRARFGKSPSRDRSASATPSARLRG